MRELAASVSVSRSLGQVVRRRQPSAQRPEKSGRACGSMLGSGMFFFRAILTEAMFKAPVRAATC